MSKKFYVTLIPRYEGKCAIVYERIWSTIRKTRLYKFIRVPYSQPLTTRWCCYCTFDLNWQPGPWKPRILLSPQYDYGRTGENNKKSHLGHGLTMKISGDMLGLRLLNKKHLYLIKCHFSFKILMKCF